MRYHVFVSGAVAPLGRRYISPMRVTLPPEQSLVARAALRHAISSSGLSASLWAAQHGWQQSYVAQVLSGARAPSDAILSTLGLRVVLERIEPPRSPPIAAE